MKINSYLLIAILISGITNLFAQKAGDIVWEKLYGGGDYDELMAVTESPFGGFIGAGYTQSYDLGRWGNAFFVKADFNGDSVWTHHMGGDGIDVFADMITTPDSMFVATGLTDTENDFENIYLVKINDDGIVQWEKNFGGPEKEVAQALTNSHDGGIIITGVTKSFSVGEEDLFIFKTNLNGDSLWFKTYGTTGNDGGYGITPTSDGGYIIAGIYNWSDMWLVKIDADGDTLWTSVIGGNDFEEALSVQQTADGGYIIAGSTASFGAGQLDAFLVKTDSLGNVEWQKTYGGSGYDEGRRVIVNNSNEYVLMANTDSGIPGDMNYFIVWTDLNGDTIRTKTYGDLGTDRCFDMILVDEEFLLIAATNFNDVTDGDASLLLIYSENEPTGVENEYETLPDGFVLYDAYPNPFNPVTTIKYSIPNTGSGLTLSVYLVIFDILGNEITTLVNEEKSAGIHEVEFNASHLSSGTYFYRLNAVDNTTGMQFSEIKKLMLIK